MKIEGSAPRRLRWGPQQEPVSAVISDPAGETAGPVSLVS